MKTVNIHKTLVHTHQTDFPNLKGVPKCQYAFLQGKIQKELSSPKLLSRKRVKASKIENNGPVPPVDLDYYALTLGLGYKTANLIRLQKQAAQIGTKLNVCQVLVPPFLGLCDCEMQAFLHAAIPQLKGLWEQFKDAFQQTHALPETCLRINTAGRKILESIQNEIKQAFTSQVFFPNHVQQWLEKENPNFIIVRSTGKEDSETNANAGGNESISFVKPDAQDISEAIGQVIASYFSEKSLSQRLLAGDRTIFSEEPFVPVLLQVMVSEEGNEILRAGVLFTAQKDKAAGVTLIQTGYGSNEGVVNSQVAVDSYYVDAQHNIHAVIRKKTTRFVNMQANTSKYCLHAVKNGSAMIENSAALPNAMIHDLKRVADEISSIYGGIPMDVEYTIKLRERGGKAVIYLLQARPLQGVQEQANPKSFLHLQALKNLPAENKLSVDTMLDGNAYVRTVEQKDQVIFVDTLEAGLEAFKQAAEPSKLQAIMVQQSALATSHAAVTLRPKGIPVLVLGSKYEMVKKMMAASSPAKPVLIDTQRGLLAAMDSRILARDAIAEGLVSYPIPLELTVPYPQWLLALSSGRLNFRKDAQDIIEMELKGQMQRLHNQFIALMQEIKAERRLPIETSLRELLDVMATQPIVPAKLAVGAVLETLQRKLFASLKATQPFRQNLHLQTLQVFQEALRIAIEQVLPAIEQHEPQTLERLYPIKFLDALIFQRPCSNVVGAFSYAKILETDACEGDRYTQGIEQGFEFSEANGLPLLQLLHVSLASFSPEIAAKWENFLRGVTDHRDLLDLVEKIRAMGFLPIWLNVLFTSIHEECNGQTAQIVAKLQNSYRIDQELLQWIDARHADLDILEQSTKTWEDPVYAAKHIDSLKKKYLGFGFDPGQNHFKAKFEQASGFGKLALLQFMQRSIQAYDLIIKAVSGSAKYDEDAKQKRLSFALLLEGYFDVFKACLQLVSPEQERELMALAKGFRATPFSEYLEKMASGTGYEFHDVFHKSVGFMQLVADAKQMTGDAKQAFISRNEFNVAAFVIGSKGDLDFSAHWPTRLEEYFTAFHQNMEKVVKTLMTKHGLNASLLPEEIREICQYIHAEVAIRDSLNQNLPSEPSYINQEGEYVEVVYQVPLRQHAGGLKIRYNPRKIDDGFDLALYIFGSDEHDRWDQTAAFGVMLGNWLGVSLTHDQLPQINYQGKRSEVGFSLRVPAGFSKKAELIDAVRYILKTMTMKSCGGPAGLGLKLEHYCSADWENVPEAYFRRAFYMSVTILNRFADNSALTMKVASNSLLGLSSMGLQDYSTERGVPIELPGYVGEKKYKFVPGNKPETKSLVAASVLHLIKALENNVEGASALVQELIHNEDMCKALPQVVAALTRPVRLGY